MHQKSEEALTVSGAGSEVGFRGRVDREMEWSWFPDGPALKPN